MPDSNLIDELGLEDKETIKLEKIGVPKKLPDRCTLIFNAYCQFRGETPDVVQKTYVRLCESGEQPFVRFFDIDESWSTLNLGWIEPKNCAYLIIENMAGNYLTVIPTEKERNEISKKQVLLAFAPNVINGLYDFCWTIDPGFVFCASTKKSGDLILRSVEGNIPCKLTIIPK